MNTNRKQFSRGLRVGVPISLGYLAVSFTLGITAKNAGLSAFQATLTSLLVNASAGQYAAFTAMAAQSGYLEIAILEAVTNARYILMSCSLSQKLPPRGSCGTGCSSALTSTTSSLAWPLPSRTNSTPGITSA